MVHNFFHLLDYCVSHKPTYATVGNEQENDVTKWRKWGCSKPHVNTEASANHLWLIITFCLQVEHIRCGLDREVFSCPWINLPWLTLLWGEKIYIYFKMNHSFFFYLILSRYFFLWLFVDSEVMTETMKLLIQMTKGVLSNARGPFGKVSDVGNVRCADSAFSHL